MWLALPWTVFAKQVLRTFGAGKKKHGRLSDGVSVTDLVRDYLPGRAALATWRSLRHFTKDRDGEGRLNPPGGLGQQQSQPLNRARLH